MNQKQTAMFLALAQAAYPHNKISPETAQVWTHMLEPMDNTTTTRALERHIRESRYFPTIAEIFDNIAADKRAIAEHRLVELEAEYRAEEPPMNAERAKAIAENSRKILKVMKP